MQIYCKKCLAMIYVAKYYPVCWYCNRGDEDSGKQLNEFLTKHSSECFESDEDADRQWGEDMFGLRTKYSDDGLAEFRCPECNKWHLKRKDNFLSADEIKANEMSKKLDEESKIFDEATKGDKEKLDKIKKLFLNEKEKYPLVMFGKKTMTERICDIIVDFELPLDKKNN